jgi:hypothetical protein
MKEMDEIGMVVPVEKGNEVEKAEKGGSLGKNVGMIIFGMGSVAIGVVLLLWMKRVNESYHRL